MRTLVFAAIAVALTVPAISRAQGVTAAFNLNLLARINHELGADFDLRRFAHYAFYNPLAGRIEGYRERWRLKPDELGPAHTQSSAQAEHWRAIELAAKKLSPSTGRSKYGGKWLPVVAISPKA